MYSNPNVSIEQEREEAAFWKFAQKQCERESLKLIHGFRQENTEAVKAAATERIKDFQEMLAVVADAFNKWPRESAEGIILQRQIDRLAAEIVKERRKLTPRKYDNEVTPEMIERAKEYPISNIIDISRKGMGFMCCLWHDDKHPSMKLLESQNRLYCFSQCRKGFDAIDVYMKINNSTFFEAVRNLQ